MSKVSSSGLPMMNRSSLRSGDTSKGMLGSLHPAISSCTVATPVTLTVSCCTSTARGEYVPIRSASCFDITDLTAPVSNRASTWTVFFPVMLILLVTLLVLMVFSWCLP